MLRLAKGRQSFPADHVADPGAVVRAEIARVGLSFERGTPIAIAVGSRGIARLREVVTATVAAVRERGGEPFIIPAMGSHGGATADGQREVLASYGVTEEATGAPVRSSMDVVELPRGDAPCRVFMDRLASQAAGTILINRVKPHTDYHGPHESGLVKMSVIGLGKHAQALEVHRHGTRGLREFIPVVSRQVVAHGNLVLGIGLVENAYHELAEIRAARPQELAAVDGSLLERARTLMPRLPADDIDVLIVDELGKDVSGTGLDTNIIGRMYIKGDAEPASPRIKAIVVCDLTEASHGNALGMGLADVITRRLYDKVDLAAVAQNVITSTFLERGKMPLVAPNDRSAFEWAVRACGPIEPDDLRVLRVRSTLHLEQFQASERLWGDIAGRPAIARVENACSPAFDERGALRPL
jgi:hypothetical protein